MSGPPDVIGDILAQALCTLAFCWRLERCDGVTIGLTSHDRDLTIAGVPYRAAPGMTPSAVRRGSGLDPENMDVQGALSSGAISDADLDAGRWDGAAVALYLTEWTAPGTLWLRLAQGTIGAVERSGEGFTAELAGAAGMLDAPVAPETSPDCRAMLGDRACRVDLARRRRMVTVEHADEAEIIVSGGLDADLYRFGSLRWMGGDNAGIVQPVAASGAAGVTLADPPPFAVAAGVRALLTEGCDKRMATCAARFGNAANFQGEPYLPGNDLLTRYPGA